MLDCIKVILCPPSHLSPLTAQDKVLSTLQHCRDEAATVKDKVQETGNTSKQQVCVCGGGGSEGGMCVCADEVIYVCVYISCFCACWLIAHLSVCLVCAVQCVTPAEKMIYLRAMRLVSVSSA